MSATSTSTSTSDEQIAALQDKFTSPPGSQKGTRKKKGKGKGATTEEAEGEGEGKPAAHAKGHRARATACKEEVKGEGEGEGKPARGAKGCRARAKASMEEVDDMMNELLNEGKGHTPPTHTRTHGRGQRSYPKANTKFTPETHGSHVCRTRKAPPRPVALCVQTLPTQAGTNADRDLARVETQRLILTRPVR